ncbi:MAG: hydroxymethylglutaryl-CoA lyase [Pseudomonadota bacterium]|nr:hydroxymethylglutaryl-CoA lyase [Pseudomonadota bacterium]MEC8700267.1 hydroxymethylglutaryl-CoA lyase [Pseudomonadota bacterium]
MSDMPTKVDIQEEGPREGFQIEPGPISTERKIELIDALSETGLHKIQVASFVNPKRVPGWADADDVIRGFKAKEGVVYHALWLNEKGIERAMQHSDRLTHMGSISTTASETFMKHNTNRGFEINREVQRGQIKLYKKYGIPVRRASIMTAFGCNFEGEIAPQLVVDRLKEILNIADEEGTPIEILSIADTMGWAAPNGIKQVVGKVRETWPEKRICLHLHDTRGMGVANVYAGLEMGVDLFDSSVAGLGGCPFAALKGAAGNVCTEDIVFLCNEHGIETGIDLDMLIEVARLAEDIVGHPLPGSIMHAGSLTQYKVPQAAE